MPWIENLERRRLFASVPNFVVSPVVDIGDHAATYEYFFDETGYHWRAQLEEYRPDIDWYVPVRTIEGTLFRGGADAVNTAFIEAKLRDDPYNRPSGYTYKVVNYADDTFEVKAVRIAEGQTASGYELIHSDAPAPGRIDLDIATHFSARYDLPDGKVLLFGQAGHLGGGGRDVQTLMTDALARYNADGTLDTTFAGKGYVLPLGMSGYGPNAEISVARDGTIVVWNGAGTVYRFAADGAELSPVFNVRDAAFDRQGKLYYLDGTDNLLRRLAPDGTDDASFTPVRIDAQIERLTVGADTLYLATESTVRAIDLHGKTVWSTSIMPPDASKAQIVDVRVDSSDRVIIGWDYTVAERKQDITFPWHNGQITGVAVARLNADGGLDTSFGESGFVTQERDPSTLYAIDLLSDGSIRLIDNGARTAVGFTTLSESGAVLSRRYADVLAVLVLEESPFNQEPVVEITWHGLTGKMMQGQWIVGFNASYGVYELNDILASLNLGLRGERLLGSDWAVVHSPTTLSPDELEAALKTLPTYRSMEPNFVGTYAGVIGMPVTPSRPPAEVPSAAESPLTPPDSTPRSSEDDDPLVAPPQHQGIGGARASSAAPEAIQSSWSTYFDEDDDPLERLADSAPIVT